MNLSSVYFGVLLIIAFVIRATATGNLARYIGILVEPPLDPLTAASQSGGYALPSNIGQLGSLAANFASPTDVANSAASLSSEGLSGLVPNSIIAGGP